jgi:hypothetical protein
MKFIISIVSLLAVASTPASAAPTEVLEVRQNSGCYAFEDPDCCIDYAVCQCANGKGLLKDSVLLKKKVEMADFCNQQDGSTSSTKPRKAASHQYVINNRNLKPTPLNTLN